MPLLAWAIVVAAAATASYSAAQPLSESTDEPGRNVVQLDGFDPRPGREHAPLLYVSRSALRQAVLAFITAQPDATLQEVAAFANAGIGRLGLTYMFDYSAAKEPLPDALWLEGEEVTLLLRLRDDPISEGSGPCGEVWAPLPVTDVRKDTLTVAHWRDAYRVARPRGLVLDEMKIWSSDRARLLATVEVPWQTIPFGVTPDGRGVLVYDPLYEQGSQWWRSVKNAHPDIVGDTPFLLLAVSEEGFRYVGDPALYAPHAAEQLTDQPHDPDNAYLGYTEFLNPHVIVEYTAPCT
jgi:hypothetical protein